jgi:hypothetical protein
MSSANILSEGGPTRTPTPRDGSVTFDDLVGRLVMLRVSCDRGCRIRAERECPTC